MTQSRTVRAAAVQIAPDLHEASKTLARVLDAIDQAAAKGAEIVVFPETFVPYYPYFSFITPAMLAGAAARSTPVALHYRRCMDMASLH